MSVRSSTTVRTCWDRSYFAAAVRLSLSDDGNKNKDFAVLTFSLPPTAESSQTKMHYSNGALLCLIVRRVALLLLLCGNCNVVAALVPQQTTAGLSPVAPTHHRHHARSITTTRCRYGHGGGMFLQGNKNSRM